MSWLPAPRPSMSEEPEPDEFTAENLASLRSLSELLALREAACAAATSQTGARVATGERTPLSPRSGQQSHVSDAAAVLCAAADCGARSIACCTRCRRAGYCGKRFQTAH